MMDICIPLPLPEFLAVSAELVALHESASWFGGIVLCFISLLVILSWYRDTTHDEKYIRGKIMFSFVVFVAGIANIFLGLFVTIPMTVIGAVWALEAVRKLATED